MIHPGAAAIVVAAMKRRSHKQWLKAEYEFRCECIAHDYPYPYPRVTDSPRMDKARRARAREKMDKAIVLKYFPPVSPPSPLPALAPVSPAAADPPRPISPLPVTAAPPHTTVPASSAPAPADPHVISKSAEELKADINKHLPKRPPVFVVSRVYVRRMIKAGACCILLKNNNETQIEGDKAKRPLLIVRKFEDMSAAGFDCQCRFIHDNENRDDNYVLCAYIGSIEKSNDLELPNDIDEIYSLHKENIITANAPHHGSYGLYYADGLKASYQKMDKSQSSIDNYATYHTDAQTFVQFQSAQNAINSCIHQANDFLVNELSNEERNEDVIKLAANSSCVKLLNELYSMSSLSQTKPLGTLHHGENDLHWCSSNVCIDAGTKQYHTEIDTSMTLIHRPYFQSCCHRKCSQHRTTFNFKVPINSSEELKIPLVDGCVILFSGYLLKHRQQNVVHEKTNAFNHNCKTEFINISCYSNGRFANNMTKTSERVFDNVK